MNGVCGAAVMSSDYSVESFGALARSVRGVVRVEDFALRRVDYVSPSFESLWGRPIEEAPTDPFAWWAFVHQDDRAGVRSVWATEIERDSQAFDYRLVRPDGTVLTVRERVVPVFDEDGRIAKRIFMTEEAGPELMRGASQVQSDRLAGLGLLAGGIVHEIANPLATILLVSSTGLLNRSDPARLVGALEQVSEQARRCAGMVRSLTQLVRKDVLEKEAGSFNECVRSSVSFSSAYAAAAGCRVDVQLDDDIPAITINRIGIEQVLMNLIRNACDAGAKLVEVRTLIETDTVWTTVADDGRGIAPELHERVFEPFYRAGDDDDGLGIGLYLARSIIEAHGGTIGVATDGGGATIRFSLPLVGD